jgi:hypothetical protein
VVGITLHDVVFISLMCIDTTSFFFLSGVFSFSRDRMLAPLSNSRMFRFETALASSTLETEDDGHPSDPP